ncbi:hypothetical protein Pint_12162 [Pistacia integerrima]|uniref:Uncharacterized protein n=1 Tax=Pistacia integerrima TaxID=434235 RepID=A0ACC0XHL1_9ROSI|nr:hypothetical protein Pint_12162 [Pistacia integerrima]
MFDLRIVLISVPLPSLREAPSVRQFEGSGECIGVTEPYIWKHKGVKKGILVQLAGSIKGETMGIGGISEKVNGENWQGRYDSRNCVLEWPIFLIDKTIDYLDRMEFVVPPADSLALSPYRSVCYNLVVTSYLHKVSVIHISGVWTNTRKSNASKFELILAFDEAISLGLKENLTIAQVKQRGEMESDEGKLHKLNRGEKGGFMSLQSMGSGRIESSFSDMSISSGGGGFFSCSGVGLSTDVYSFSSKSKGHPPSSGTAPPKGLGMQLGKSQRTNQFLEFLKAEGEVILEDVQPKAGQSRLAAPPPNDPITLTVEEKFNVTLKRDGGMGNFDVQGTLSLQIVMAAILCCCCYLFSFEGKMLDLSSIAEGLTLIFRFAIHVVVISLLFITIYPVLFQIETGGNPAILFDIYPNMNKELHQ